MLFLRADGASAPTNLYCSSALRTVTTTLSRRRLPVVVGTFSSSLAIRHLLRHQQHDVVALLNELPSATSSTGFASLSCGDGTDPAFVRGISRTSRGASSAAAKTAASAVPASGTTSASSATPTPTRPPMGRSCGTAPSSTTPARSATRMPSRTHIMEGADGWSQQVIF